MDRIPSWGSWACRKGMFETPTRCNWHNAKGTTMSMSQAWHLLTSISSVKHQLCRQQCPANWKLHQQKQHSINSGISATMPRMGFKHLLKHPDTCCRDTKRRHTFSSSPDSAPYCYEWHRDGPKYQHLFRHVAAATRRRSRARGQACRCWNLALLNG